MLTRELRGVNLVLEQPKFNLITTPDRTLNYTFCIAEWLWMLTGRTDVGSIDYFNPNIKQFSDDGKTMNGSYGPKLVEQLPYVIKTLAADRDSRQALLTIWRERPAATKDVPCTCLMQFFVRGNAVDMICYMRSNDLWLGFPYDVFNFTMIQGWVAAELSAALGEFIRPGRYHHMVGSLHLYDNNFENAATARASLVNRTLDDLMTPFPSTNPSLNELSYWFGVFSNDEWYKEAHRTLCRLDDMLSYPWNDYFRVMAYRTTNDRATLIAPWNSAYRRTRGK